ncbi:hypothetical protein DPMN_154757 [Dreissena polymorpha]|uniref:Uncharacterized protein n=1 Tax=Dreissena polymorpha TaxID=45954 RepID=A0A9D4J610_DREPO|nr:hypothetical protein DPMN_154757 [Dreissena polymorpha]
MFALFGYILICSHLQAVQGLQECNAGNHTFVNCTYSCCPVNNSTYEECCQKQGPNECYVGNQTFVNCSHGCCQVTNSTFEQCCQLQDSQESFTYTWHVLWTLVPLAGMIGGLLYFCFCKIP